MAPKLIHCPACNKEVANTAPACPACGAPIKKRRSIIVNGCLSLIIIFILIGTIGGIADTCSGSKNSAPQSSPTQSAPVAPLTASASEAPAPAPAIKPNAAEQVYKLNDSFRVGYWSYTLRDAAWIAHLSSNQFMDQRPDASWLYLRLRVRNDDKSASMLPPFKLVDEQGNEYETSSKEMFMDGAFDLIKTLNPGVISEGNILFDVPANHTYQLLCSGGFTSTAKARVAFTPHR